jgi:YidC/Oxa1 family membrane protein insertase
VPVIIGFPAGLIVYWITTNIWTIGQQLAIKKWVPTDPTHTKDAAKPAETVGARGKPKPAVAAAVAGDSKPRRGSSNGSDGDAAKTPPPGPRKKKKRSGRRR